MADREHSLEPFQLQGDRDKATRLSTMPARVPVADGYLTIALRAACPGSETGRDTKPGHRNQMGSLNTKDPSEVAKAWLGLHQCSALRCVHIVCCNSTSGLHAISLPEGSGDLPGVFPSSPSGFLYVPQTHLTGPPSAWKAFLLVIHMAP